LDELLTVSYTEEIHSAFLFKGDAPTFLGTNPAFGWKAWGRPADLLPTF